MGRQVSGSQAISTTEVATSVGFSAGDYVYRYGANLVGFPKSASNSIGALATAIGGTVYSDFIMTGLSGQQVSAAGPAVDTALYTGTTRAISTPLVAAASVNAATSYNNNKVAALQGGNYVHVYFTAASTLTAAIYDTTGTMVGSAVTISTSAENNTLNRDTVAVAGLTDGGYVVVFTGASSHPQYVRVNSSNTITAGPSNIRSSVAYGSNNNNKSVCGMSDGGFAVVMCSASGTSNAYLASYASNNTLYWAADIDAGFNIYGGNSGFDSISIVQSGIYLNIACANWDTDPCTGQAYICYGLNCWSRTGNSRIGSKVQSANSVATRTYPSKVQVCPIIGSLNAALFSFTTTNQSVTHWTIVAGVNQGAFSSTLGSAQSYWTVATANGNFQLVYVGTDSVVKLLPYTKNSSAYQWTAGTPQTLYNSAAIGFTGMCASMGRNGRIFVSFPNASSHPMNMQISSYDATNGTTYIQGSAIYTPVNNYSLIGVALTSAAPGSSGTVQTSGTIKLSAEYPPAQSPIYFSYVNNAYGPYGGNAGYVSGTTVTLEGL